MKSDFHEEIVQRLKKRRNKKSNTWLSLLVKIIILVFLVLLMKNFQIFKKTAKSPQQQTEQIIGK